MVTDVTKLNFSKHIITSSTKDMHLLSSQLDTTLQIKHFSFKRLYASQEFIFLTTHPEMFIRMSKHPQKILGARNTLTNINLLSIGLLDYTPLQIAKNEFNLDNGLILIRNYNDYCEFIYFLSDPLNYKVNNSYFNNINYFEKFVDYFKSKTNRLIMEYEKNKIIFPLDFPDYILNKHALENETTIKELMEIFTEREKQCMKYLLKGFTYKMIARDIGISYRTVEKHFENIRLKFHAKNHSDLLVKILRLSTFVS
jgi:DNA-binding CsgD family transcriptional regulator